MQYKYKLKEMSKTASPEAAAKELERKEGEPFKVGQVSYSSDGTSKSTIYKIDDTTGAVSWKIEQLPGYDKMFEELDDLVDIAKRTASKSKDDPKFRDFYDQIRQIRNQVRTHIRKEHPEIYDRIQMRMAEGINDHIDLVHVYRDGEMFGTGELVKDLGNGKVRVRFDRESEGTFLAKNVKPVKEDEFAGSDPKAGSTIQGAGFDWKRVDFDKEEKEVEEMSTSAGAGSYLTKYAFKLPKKQKKLPEGTCGYDTDAKSGKKLKTPGGLKENVGATLGPGPKAGPDGVKDNYYVTKFKYKLVPKDKNGNYVQKGSGLEVKNF